MVLANRLKFIAALIAALALADPASAATINQSFNFSQFEVPASGATNNFNIQLFDSSLGVLTGVKVSLTADMTTKISILNLSGQAYSFFNASASIPFTISGPAGTSVNATPKVNPSSGTLATVTTPQLFGGTTITESNTATFTDNLGAWIGSGSTAAAFAVLLQPGSYSGLVSRHCLPEGCGAPPAVSFGGAAFASGNVSIEYNYSPTPLPAALPMMVSGLVAIGMVLRRKRQRLSLQ